MTTQTASDTLAQFQSVRGLHINRSCLNFEHIKIVVADRPGPLAAGKEERNQDKTSRDKDEGQKPNTNQSKKKGKIPSTVRINKTEIKKESKKKTNRGR